MNTGITVTGKGDISKAAALVEQSFKGDGSETCTLLCETMLLHLMDSGLDQIQVEVKRRWVDLAARGPEVDFDLPANLPEDTRQEMEIGLCILESHKNQIDLRYKKGVNRCRIYLQSKKELDLSAEIEAYYDGANDGNRHSTFGVLAYLARHHRARLIVSLFFMTLKHVAAVMLPVFASGIIDQVVGGEQFFSRGVILNILGSILALATNLACFWVETVLYRSFTRAVEAGLKMALVKRLQLLSMRFHQNSQSGTLLSKLISDVQFVEMLIYARLREALYLIIDVGFVLAVSLLRFPPFLLFYVTIVPLTVVGVRHFSRPVMAKKTFMRRQTESSNAAFQEMLTMNQLTRAHGLQFEELRKISTKVRRVQEAAKAFDNINVFVNCITYGGFQSVRLLCLCVAGYLMTKGRISVGTVVLFQSLYDTIINSTQKVLDELPETTQGVDSLASINEILFERDIERNGTRRLPMPMRGEIELSHVSFAYEADAEPVLSDVSLTVPAGKVVAFVGESGSGKSTLLQLILGMYSPTEGEIRVDGENLDTLDKNDFRHNLAVVPQNTVLFSGTLWENLVYGLKYVSRSRVLEVLRSVGLDELLKSLPNGLDSEIMENGGNLSGGQRQRIAIARALLRDAKIVLFDEATSALDTKSEQQVQSAIDTMMSRCTVIMVAHRLNTLKKADIIYRIENGRAERVPSFEALMSNSSEADILA